MNGIKAEIKEYLKDNMGTYTIIIIFFIFGVLAGAIVIRGLDEAHHQVLNQYFTGYVNNYLSGAAGQDQAVIFRQSLGLNFRHLVLVWLLGIFIFGFPMIIALLAWRGFSIGFTVGFLVKQAAARGMLFALGAVLPHNLILIPAIFVLVATAFSFSWYRFRGYLSRKPYGIKDHLGPYTMMILITAAALFFGCLVEAYISPVFTRLLMPMLQG